VRQANNSLRFDCTVTVDPPQPVQIAFSKADGTGAERIHASSEALGLHHITLYVMAPETRYSYAVSAPEDPGLPQVTGELVTGALPLEAELVVSVDGEPSSALIGFASPCVDGAYVDVVDPTTGEIVWYHNMQLSQFGLLDAVSFTEDGTALAIVDGSLVEVDPGGNTVMVALRGPEIQNLIHHDVFRHDGLTYVLFKDHQLFDDVDFLLDGVYVLDGSDVVAEWRLVDTGFVPHPRDSDTAIDYSHANAIWVGDDGQALVSFRHLSAVLQIEGDPTDVEFGAVRWALSHPDSDYPSDFTIGSAVGPPADFERQHNVSILPDGRLLMFDNRLDFNQRSRVLEIALPSEATTSTGPGPEATIVRELALPAHCDYQGGAQLTPSGNVLATCAPLRDGYEFDVNGKRAWSIHTECIGTIASYIPRYIPVDW
jgi:hypothetical protein